LAFQSFRQEKVMQFASSRGSRVRACAAALLFAYFVGGIVGGAAQTATQPQTISQKIAASRDLLDINAASPAELNALPGMGAAYTQRVIAGRPYTAKNQLTTRGVLPTDEYARIKELIIAHRVKK
jgi:competence protein ComEA